MIVWNGYLSTTRAERWGFGSIATLTFGETHTTEYKVAAKDGGYFQLRDCDYRLQLRDAEGKDLPSICTSRASWEYVSTGDTVKTMERRLRFGTYLDRYERRK